MFDLFQVKYEYVDMDMHVQPIPMYLKRWSLNAVKQQVMISKGVG